MFLAPVLHERMYVHVWNSLCEHVRNKGFLNFRSKQQNLGFTEENDFLKLSVTNMSAELVDLKAKTKVLQERRGSIHSHLGNSDDESFFQRNYKGEDRFVASPIIMNSTFNNKQDNNTSTTSLMEEVTPFLQDTSPIKTKKTPNINIKKSLLSVHNRTPMSTRKNLNRQLLRNTAPVGRIEFITFFPNCSLYAHAYLRIFGSL